MFNKDELIEIFVRWGLVIVVLSLVLLYSCSPIQRLERFEKRHPYLFNRANDTITFIDTVRAVVPGVQIDTTFSWDELNDNDTLQIVNGQLNLKLWKQKDSLGVSATVDTVFVEVVREIEVPFIQYQTLNRPRDSLRCLWITIAISTVIALVIVIYILRINKKDG